MGKQILESDDEGSFGELKDVDSIEHFFLEDVANVRSNDPNVNVFIVDWNILGKGIGVVQEEYEDTSVFEFTEILSAACNLIPSVIDQVLKLSIIPFFFLFNLSN